MNLSDHWNTGRCLWAEHDSDWRAESLIRRANYASIRAAVGKDLDTAWRLIFDVSRESETMVERVDEGEYGTLYRYASGRMARWHLFGHSEIRLYHE